MMKFDCLTGENIKYHNPNWLQIPDHPYRILITSSSGLGKRNTSHNLISHQPDIRKLYLNAKDLYEAKYKLLIEKCESVGLKHCSNPKAFNEYSNDMGNIYENVVKNATRMENEKC